MARKGARVTGLDLADDLLQVATTARAGVRRRTWTIVLEAAEAHASAHAGAVRRRDLHGNARARARPDASWSMRSARWCEPGGHVFVSTLNRTLKAYAARGDRRRVRAATAAGGHAHLRQVHRAVRALRGGRAQRGLEVVDIAGLDYDPFARTTRLTMRRERQLPRCTCGATVQRGRVNRAARSCSISTARCSTPRPT